MANEELKQALGDDYVIIARGKAAKSTTVAIVFARAYIVMMRWTLSWMKTKVSLMMMRNN
jgi:hypothetical protein